MMPRAIAGLPRCIFPALLAVLLFNALSSPNAATLRRVAFLNPSGQLGHVSETVDKSRWQVDLHPHGYPPGDPSFQFQSDLGVFDSVAFLSDDVLAATFFTREAVTGLQRRDDPNRSLPFLLHAVFMESSTGKIVKTMEWPVESQQAGIFSIGDGGFVVFSTNRITRYGADWKIAKEIIPSQLQSGGGGFVGLAAAPGGKFLMVLYNKGGTSHCLWIPTDTLESADGPCAMPEKFTISDSETAIQGESEKKSSVSQVLIGNRETPWHMLCNTKLVDTCRVPKFLNNVTLAVYDRTGLALVGVDGTVLLRKHYDAVDGWLYFPFSPIRGSASGRRFALILNHTPTDTPMRRSVLAGRTTYSYDVDPVPGPFPDRIEVYDLASHAWIYTVRNKAGILKKILGLALSPGGEHMAMDSGGVIRCYGLPRVAGATPQIK